MQPGWPSTDSGKTSVYEFVREGSANLRVDLPITGKCDADLAVVLATTPVGSAGCGPVIREALDNDNEALARWAAQLIGNSVDFSFKGGTQAASDRRIQGLTFVTQYES